MSTKTGPVMQAVPPRVPSGLLEHDGPLREVLPHRGVVPIFLKHQRLQQVADKPRDTRVLLRGTDPRPSRNGFIERDGNILHDAKLP